MLPTADEVAALPRGARLAFAARCATRVLPLVRLDVFEEDGVAAAAVAILRTASDPRALSFIRRDLNALKRLVREEKWTDDTPVPPEVFGPLWPDGRAPKWARAGNGMRGCCPRRAAPGPARRATARGANAVTSRRRALRRRRV